MSDRNRPWAAGPDPDAEPSQDETIDPTMATFDHPETDAEPEGPTFDELHGDGEQIIRIQRDADERIRITEEPVRVARPAGFGPPPSPVPIGYARDERRRPGRGVDRARDGDALPALRPQTMFVYALTFAAIIIIAALTFVIAQGLITHELNPFGLASPIPTSFGPR